MKFLILIFNPLFSVTLLQGIIIFKSEFLSLVIPLIYFLSQFISSVAHSCLTLCDPMDWSKPGFHVHHQLPDLLRHMCIESVMPSNHLILCRSFSFCLQSFIASGSFQWSRFFTSGSQSIGVSASTSVLPKNTQD